MTKDEALKLALEALEAAYARLVTKCEQNLVTYNGVDVDTLTLSQEAITAIKEALAQPEQEPVGCAEHGVINWLADKQFNHTSFLYTTPPQRKPLTDEEIAELQNAWKHQTQLTVFGESSPVPSKPHTALRDKHD